MNKQSTKEMLITTQVLCMKRENDSSFHILFKRVFVDKEWPKTNYMADLSIKFFEVSS